MTEEIREERFLGETIHAKHELNLKSLVNGAINSEEANTDIKSKKISKRSKGFRWKLMWIKQKNAVIGSKPLWVQKWVRVKIPQHNQDSIEENG